MHDSPNESLSTSSDEEDAIAAFLVPALPKSKRTTKGYRSTRLQKGKEKVKLEEGEEEEEGEFKQHKEEDLEATNDDSSPFSNAEFSTNKTEETESLTATPKRGRHRKQSPITVSLVSDDVEKSEEANAEENYEVHSMLIKPSKPRMHKHGHRASSRTRRSQDRLIGSSAAPVHTEHDHSHDGSPGPVSSPIQTRSHCTYHKLSIPIPEFLSVNTPSRRLSLRLARAADSAQFISPHYIFLVPGCATSDRKDKMLEEGMLDLGEASIEEEGEAVKLAGDGDDYRTEGLPDEIIQSLIRVVGLDMFSKGDCEILPPILRLDSMDEYGSVTATFTDRKRKRESDIEQETPSKRSNVFRQ